MSVYLIVQEIYNKNSRHVRSTVEMNAYINKGDAKWKGVIADGTSIHLSDQKENEFSRNGECVKKNITECIEILKNDKIDKMITKLRSMVENPVIPVYFWNSSLLDLTKRFGDLVKTEGRSLKGYLNSQCARKVMPWDLVKNTESYNEGNRQLHDEPNLPNWQLVHREIRQFALYSPDNPAVDGLLNDMATNEITEIDDTDAGTQFKLILNFKDGGRAVFKPMRFPRDVGTNPNHYIFDDMERHVAEIASFHLDRLLGFYRVPPTIGRIVNITREIEPLVSDNIYNTIHISPAGNVCFYGVCYIYCDSAHAFCGNPDMLEGSVMSYLPSEQIAPKDSWDQPWKRSYSEHHKAAWETDETFCETVRHEPPFNNGKMLLDIIDAHTFDFLTGNKDRHSFELFEEFENYTFPIMLDNGKGFGRQDYDAMSILAPLRQCCIIRRSTFLKYVRLYIGPHKLSTLMSKSLASDPVSPVLLPGHLKALDRRLRKILLEVAKCLEAGTPASQVIIADNF